MAEHNTCNNATSGSNDDANQTIGRQSSYMNESNKMDIANDDGASIKNSLVGNPGNDSKKSSADSSSLRSMEEANSSEFDALRDDDVMAMMDNHSNKVGKKDNDNFGTAYPRDTDMAKSNPNDSMDHHYYNGSNEQDRDNASVASQATFDDGDFNYNEASIHSDVDGSPPSKENATASWFGEEKTAASMKAPHASNMTNDKEGSEQARNMGKAGQKHLEDPQDLPEASDESAQLMNDISSKLDEKLENTRSMVKRLLQEMTVYVQSLEAVAIEYQRIRESEVRESQHLDTVEPSVNGTSDMFASGTTSTTASLREQQAQKKPTEAHPHRNSSPKEERRPILPRRYSSLTPVINNHRRNKIVRDGKENGDSRRRSFG